MIAASAMHKPRNPNWRAGWLAISHRKWDSKVQTSVGQFSLSKEPPVTRLTSLGKKSIISYFDFCKFGANVAPVQHNIKEQKVKGKGWGWLGCQISNWYPFIHSPFMVASLVHKAIARLSNTRRSGIYKAQFPWWEAGGSFISLSNVLIVHGAFYNFITTSSDIP